jgi:membrane-bound serine protease (ClpP class)
MGMHADGFLRTVWRLWWRAVWLMAFGLVGMQVHAADVVVLQVQDAIGPASADYVVRGMAKAHKAGAKLVVLELDTPGGLDTSMRQIIQAILASPIPVATWVAPEGARAASAGTYILYASHIAAMAPSTTLGAATPVAIGMQPGGERQPPGGPASAPGGGKAPGDAMTAKAVNDAAAFIRGLAQQRGRNAEWAERAVREAVTLTADEALRDKVIDVVARDVNDLLARIDGRRVRVSTGEITLATRGATSERVQPDWRHRLLSVIANPSFALILMMIGIYGLMFEFSSPGFGVAGVVGAICLLLGLFALQLLPINYAGLALIALGIALMAAEVITPTFGVLGAGGVIAFIAGGIMLIDSDLPGYGVPLPLILGLAASSALVIVAGGGMALRARRRPVQTGSESMAGTVGEIIEVDDREAWASVRGERWRVRSDAPLARGQRVRVRSLSGLVLDVAPDDSRTTAKEGTP